MRCSKCGSVNPDGSVYCCKCGNKLSIHITDGTNNNELPMGQFKEVTFSMYGTTLCFSPLYSMISYVMSFVMAEAWDGYVRLKKVFSEKEKSMETIFKYAVPVFGECLDNLANNLYDYCLKLRITTSSYEEFLNFFCEYCHIDDKLSSIYEANDALAGYAQKLTSYRELQRNSRGYWQGGGFGIRGAIRGAIKAEILNAGTKAIYSICDGITDWKDLEACKALSEKLYYSIHPNLILKQVFAECCQSSYRILLELITDTFNTPLLSFDAEKINYLDRQYKSDIERINRFGVDENLSELKELSDSIINRISAYPFDIYPYWDYLINISIAEDFSEVESIIKELKLENPYRMVYEQKLFEAAYQFSWQNYESSLDLEQAISILKWFKTSEFYVQSIDSTIRMLEEKYRKLKRNLH